MTARSRCKTGGGPFGVEEGVVRIGLRGERGRVPGVQVALDDDVVLSVPVSLVDDPREVVEVQPMGVVEVRQRKYLGMDVNGNARFDWEVVQVGESLSWEVSEEVDLFTSKQSGSVTVLYSGDVLVTEGAVVVDADGRVWDVVAVKRPPGRLELAIRRVVAS